jgi:hypothetical protein
MQNLEVWPPQFFLIKKGFNLILLMIKFKKLTPSIFLSAPQPVNPNSAFSAILSKRCRRKELVGAARKQ